MWTTRKCVAAAVLTLAAAVTVTRAMVIIRTRTVAFPVRSRGSRASTVLPPPSSSLSMTTSSSSSYSLGLGEYYVELKRPLGVILEEIGSDDDDDNGGNGGGGGVMVKEIIKGESSGGSAWKSGIVAPNDKLLRINGVDVSRSDFEQVMDLLMARDDDDDDDDDDVDDDEDQNDEPLKLVFSDGLGQLDMPKNVVQQLATSDDAFLIDAVVRQAVREIRRDGRLGELRQVEVVIGAGVQDGGNQQGERRGLARFFAVFSTDNVTTYSCNCAATDIQKTIVGGTTEDSTTCPIYSRRIQVQIVSLSCAKDEGLGRTFDLIQERKRTS